LKVVELDASLECSVCKYVVSYVAHVIEDNKTEAAIEAALEKVCTILPHALNASCVQFVVTFGPSLVTLIEKYDDPVKVCDALKLCNNGTQTIAFGKLTLIVALD
jgi:saposin